MISSLYWREKLSTIKESLGNTDVVHSWPGRARVQWRWARVQPGRRARSDWINWGEAQIESRRICIHVQTMSRTVPQKRTREQEEKSQIICSWGRKTVSEQVLEVGHEEIINSRNIMRQWSQCSGILGKSKEKNRIHIQQEQKWGKTAYIATMTFKQKVQWTTFQSLLTHTLSG